MRTVRLMLSKARTRTTCGTHPPELGKPLRSFSVLARLALCSAGAAEHCALVLVSTIRCSLDNGGSKVHIRVRCECGRRTGGCSGFSLGVYYKRSPSYPQILFASKLKIFFFFFRISCHSLPSLSRTLVVERVLSRDGSHSQRPRPIRQTSHRYLLSFFLATY